MSYEDALPHLRLIYPFMARFDTVRSLNYDRAQRRTSPDLR
ncbi:DUF4917 family protein [Pseudomonas sp. HN11]|nr:DUF4917 family protein [Pseudomonas sp. HN11]